MNNYLKSFLNRLNDPPKDIAQLLKDEKSYVYYKGYGTPELEMKFMHNVFRHIQTYHPTFESFSWIQNNCYNDNYYQIQLLSLTVNDKMDIVSEIDFYFHYNEGDKMSTKISFEAASYPDPEEIEYALENNLPYDSKEGLSETFWDAYWDFRKNKYQHLETPCLKMIAFLKLLEISFSMYYFLYTFGNGVEVKFTKEGVLVTKLDANDVEGSELGEGMN